MNETRLKGNFTGGTIIYGYSVENHKVVVNEEQAEVVRFIYEQYALGVYVKDIIQKLNEKHIFNRGKPFARNTIYNILKMKNIQVYIDITMKYLKICIQELYLKKFTIKLEKRQVKITMGKGVLKSCIYLEIN